MGPAYAAASFRRSFTQSVRFEVELYGSLAATGRGHFTDRALESELGAGSVQVRWHPETTLPFHPNGLTVVGFDAQGREIGRRTYYSVGGGAVVEEGRADESEEVYPQRSMDEVLAQCEKGGEPLWRIVEQSEGREIWGYLDTVLTAMDEALDRGLSAEGALDGGLHLRRMARELNLKARKQSGGLRRTGLLAAYAHAVAEENASIGLIVTAPTCGSCGVLPAVLRHFREEEGSSRDELLRALAVAGLFGNMVKQNGSISGAEVGCQGEVGVACAMASAAAAYLLGGSVRQCEKAAEIGLEHFLGLTCDPVCGLVQIPCIERNALAASRALVAGEMSVLSDGTHLVSFDAVVRTMVQTGHDLPSLYRETSTGGLSLYGGIAAGTGASRKGGGDAMVEDVRTGEAR